ELYQISIHFPAFQHLSSPLSILPYLSEKAQLQPDFFDTLKGRQMSTLIWLQNGYGKIGGSAVDRGRFLP
ncbi:hypothetical protein, partial [Dysosmobacter sp.]|uniref:hypothetical protein n=1 Tax=Dysosmobacter sp. TaxID=2591382 RepID=UPI003AB3D832